MRNIIINLKKIWYKENSANNCNNFISVDDDVDDHDEESLTH